MRAASISCELTVKAGRPLRVRAALVTVAICCAIADGVPLPVDGDAPPLVPVDTGTGTYAQAITVTLVSSAAMGARIGAARCIRRTALVRFTMHSASPTTGDASHKESALIDWLTRAGRVAIGFSGGVDSSYLAAVTVDTLGADNSLALI